MHFVQMARKKAFSTSKSKPKLCRELSVASSFCGQRGCFPRQGWDFAGDYGRLRAREAEPVRSPCARAQNPTWKLPGLTLNTKTLPKPESSHCFGRGQAVCVPDERPLHSPLPAAGCHRAADGLPGRVLAAACCVDALG